MRKSIWTSTILSISLALTPFYAHSATTKNKPNTTPSISTSKKVGITQSLEIALIKINFTSAPNALATGTAEIQNTGDKKKSAKFEITILAKDNKTPVFKLYSSVKDLQPGKRAFIIFKSLKEPLPTDRTFIFSFRTLDGTNR